MATKRTTERAASAPAKKRATTVLKRLPAKSATAPARSGRETKSSAPESEDSTAPTKPKPARKATGSPAKAPVKRAKRSTKTSAADAMASVPVTQPEPEADSLEGRIRYRFRDPALLNLALTHSSYVYEGRPNGLTIAANASSAARLRAQDKARSGNEPGTDNEQLELLGDAVVGLLVTELLLSEFPDRSEGELTRMRSTLVSRRRMALTGDELKLGEALRLGPTAEASGARHSTGMLANATEALLAAMYLDAQRAGDDGLALTRELVDRMLVQRDLPALRSAVAASSGRDALRDSKSTLQERVQAVSAGQLRYADVEESGPAHDRRFTVQVELTRGGHTRVLASATGRSKKEAQQAAAAAALAEWREVPSQD